MSTQYYILYRIDEHTVLQYPLNTELFDLDVIAYNPAKDIFCAWGEFSKIDTCLAQSEAFHYGWHKIGSEWAYNLDVEGWFGSKTL